MIENSAIKAKLATRVVQLTNMLSGAKLLRYWNLPDAVQIQTELQGYLQLFENAPTMNLESKEAKEDLQNKIKAAFQCIDEQTYYMMYLYAEALCGSAKHTVNNDFKEDVDRAQAAYLNKVAESVNNKQSHAPGFDSVRN